MPGILS